MANRRRERRTSGTTFGSVELFGILLVMAVGILAGWQISQKLGVDLSGTARLAGSLGFVEPSRPPHVQSGSVVVAGVRAGATPTSGNGSAPPAAFCPAGERPRFQFGFAELKAQLGATMGDPVECEHANADNGDTLQQTTTGLAFYRKTTNTATFTNGPEHWALTRSGVVQWQGDSPDPPRR